MATGFRSGVVPSPREAGRGCPSRETARRVRGSVLMWHYRCVTEGSPPHPSPASGGGSRPSSLLDLIPLRTNAILFFGNYFPAAAALATKRPSKVLARSTLASLS